MTRRYSAARAVADLRPPVRRDERITLNPGAAILLKTCFQASKGRRASVQRHPQGRSFSFHLENIGGPHSLTERPVCHGDGYAFGFGQRLCLN